MRIQISFARELALAAIHGLARYYELIESQLQSAKSAEKARIHTTGKSMSLAGEEEFAAWNIAIQEHEMTFDMLMPNFFRYSFIALLVLVVENELGKLCHAIKDVKRLASVPPSPTRDVIKEYKKYIGEQGGISTLKWDTIHELNKVRNCIVHASGKVKGSRDERFLRQLASSQAGLSVSDRVQDSQPELHPLYLEEDMLVIEPEYCRYAINSIKTFFEELCDAIPLPKIVIDQGP
jgi:hypothetical protein